MSELLNAKSVDNNLLEDDDKRHQLAALKVMKDEATTLEGNKQNDEAHAKYEELLIMQQAVLGEHHPETNETLHSFMNLPTTMLFVPRDRGDSRETPISS